MRTWIAALILMLLPFSAWAEIDPVRLYGDTIRFDVVRNGEVVGQHETRFSKVDGKLKVTSNMTLEIFVLVFPVYAFNYASVETWSNNRLRKLDVRVLDGSDTVEVSAIAKNDALLIMGPNGEDVVRTPILSTNHWNAEVLRHDKVLNTLTGRVNMVSIQRGAQETLPLPNGSVKAVRYDYNGDLTDTSVWYDQKGRWVKLQFKARDGSTIHYLCRTCEAEG
ncbi:DUF6134 family protein [Magnetovibrio sp. PR-2]|uniref:DUF6134 family protein n=1 Tax=Magnetovibrio sp. PR-2 TaxID=3120356 RepID=UPI002FCE5B40